MKVLAVVPCYPPHSLVGAWISTHECLARLAGRGHDVVVVTTLARKDPYALDEIMVLGRVDEVGVWSRIRRADVVVSHLGDDGKAHRWACAAGVPSVRMVHGITKGMHQALDGAGLAVFNSRSLAREARWEGDQIVVPPPIHRERYKTTPGSEVTLVNVSPAKGSEVFYALAERMPDVQFLGVLGGYGAQDVRPAANVAVIRPTNDMARDVYSCTRVLLMPSERETYGRTALEAACSGIPTIAHPTPGLVEALGDSGVFVDRNDIDGWEAALRRLLDPCEWKQESARSSARAALLDPDSDMNRFADALEALT